MKFKNIDYVKRHFNDIKDAWERYMLSCVDSSDIMEYLKDISEEIDAELYEDRISCEDYKAIDFLIYSVRNEMVNGKERYGNTVRAVEAAFAYTDSVLA